MPRNVYFSQGTTPEKRLHEDIVIEALKIYGHEVYYIPRKIVNENAIFNEATLSQFGEAFAIEMYVENTDGFEGDGDLLSKFGVEVRDSMTLVIANRRWEQLISRFLDEPKGRPQEGDLVYFPLVNCLFEIKYVEDESPFYQLANVATFKLTCETFEYGNEALDTGIAEIDDFETSYATQTQLTLGAGSGTYVRGEDVTQTNSTSGITVTGEVSGFEIDEVNGHTLNVTSQIASDGNNTGFTITAGNVGNIIGASSAASYAITENSDTTNGGTITNLQQDPYDDSEDFETIGNNFIDFTEDNPFGEPRLQ